MGTDGTPICRGGIILGAKILGILFSGAGIGSILATSAKPRFLL